MFSQLTSQHKKLNDDVNHMKKVGIMIGHVRNDYNQYVDSDSESELSSDLINLEISDQQDYLVSQIDDTGSKIKLCGKDFYYWTENDIYEYAEKAKFGDILKSKTIQDDQIRKGRDLSATEISVDPSLLCEIEQIWLDFGHIVKVEPYKLNVYKRGDFFLKHSDSPEENLIGTTLIDLSKDFNQSFNIHDEIWDTILGNTCSFYSDIIHEVKPVVIDYRITISFKIFLRDKLYLQSKKESVLLKKLKQSTQNFSEFILLLQHGYSYFDQNMKGIDCVISHLLKQLGYQYQIVSVIVYEHLLRDELDVYSHPEGDLKIYAINENIILNYPPDQWLSKALEWQQTMNLNNKTMPILILNKGYQWNYVEKTGAYIGNQHTGFSLDATYLNKALIVSKSNNLD